MPGAADAAYGGWRLPHGAIFQSASESEIPGGRVRPAEGHQTREGELTRAHFERSYNLAHIVHLLAPQKLPQLPRNANRRPWIPECRRPHFHRPRARDEELRRILPAGDASQS